MERGETGDGCPEPPKPFVKIVEDGFGFFRNEEGVNEIVRRYTFRNQNHLIIQVITYGAAITSVKYPDKNGISDDVVLGFDDMEGYLSPSNPYFGAIIGRCANRIAKGHFKLGEDDYQLSTNLGEHHLHGGYKGFDKANWKGEIQDKKVMLTYVSKDGEEGYPGEVLTFVSYEMTTDNEFIIEMKATSSKATPINLTNHSYFNLGGHGKGAGKLYQHIISINADRMCDTDENLIPTGMLKNVVNTLWDLRIGRKLGTVIPYVPYGGYDQCLCIHKTTSECLTFVARVVHPESGRTLEVYSNQPGVQFYTSNNLPPRPSSYGPDETEMTADGCRVMRCPLCGQLIRDPDFEFPDEEMGNEDAELRFSARGEFHKLTGKAGAEYFKHAGFCLMTQKFPDSVHRKNFPSSIIKPGEGYYHVVKYKFDLFNEANTEPEVEDVIEIPEVEGEAHEEEVKVDDDDLLDTKLEENGR